uniref:Uncharacterized protein n=1 Tax=Medicago truncatula TaxID=3880 RepID=I3SG96_MEDTR|nr:unknown [Medicago truncatula]
MFTSYIAASCSIKRFPIVGQKNSATAPLSLVIPLLIGTDNCKPEGQSWTVK